MDATATATAKALVRASASVRGDLSCEDLAILVGLRGLPEPVGRSELAVSIGMPILKLARCLRAFPLGDGPGLSGTPLIRETSPNNGLTMFVFLTDDGKALVEGFLAGLDRPIGNPDVGAMFTAGEPSGPSSLGA